MNTEEARAIDAALLAAVHLVQLCVGLARTTPNPLPGKVSPEHFAAIAEAVAEHIDAASSRAMRASGLQGPLQ